MVKDPTELVHCDNCGEDYAAAYRRCPFCNAKGGKRSAKPPVYDDFSDDFLPEDDLLSEDLSGSEPDFDATGSYASPSAGGKRLVTNRRGGGYGGGFSIARAVGYVVTALIVAAAIWVVLTQLLPRFLPAVSEPSSSPTPSPIATPVTTLTPTPTPVTPSPDSTYSEPLPAVSGVPSPSDPAVSAAPDASQAPASQAPASSQTPVSQAPAASSPASSSSLQLSSEDFTLSSRYPTYQMEISGVGRAQATYAMADPSIATVNSTGYITAVKNGVTKLTVTATDGRSATAIVRVSGFSSSAASPAPSASASPAPSASPSVGTSAKLSSTDFTLSSTNGTSYRLSVSGGTASYWLSSDESVATVSGNGTVTAVGKGTARVTCVLTDGTSLKCIVRVN